MASSASAWPVDWAHDVEVGKERFVRLPRVDWFEVADPKTAQVEWLSESNELLISGLRTGRTVVLLGADGRVAAWLIRVGTKPVLDDKVHAAAVKACPDLKWTPLETTKLTVTAHDEACRTALGALFQTDAVEARALELTFTPEALQAQLKDLQRALGVIAKGKVSAKYVGAGLVLSGAVTAADYRRALWEVLRRTLGRFALDDRLEVISPVGPLDGGSLDGLSPRH
jgi:hypothetical protein